MIEKMKYKTGIVLSGGGVKGIGHIAYLERLEELGVRPDVISGTSSGALIGAMYAAGHKPKDIIEFFKTTSFFKMKWLTRKKAGIFDSVSYINLVKAHLPEKFEDLNIPIFVTAVNIADCSIQYFHQGELYTPLIASCAVPFLISPVEMGDKMFGDGGIMDNYPITPIKDQTETLIGCYGSRPVQKDKEQLNSTLRVMNHAYELLMFANNAYKFRATKNTTILPLSEFGSFNTAEVDDIYKASKAYLSQIDPTEMKKDEYLSIIV